MKLIWITFQVMPSKKMIDAINEALTPFGYYSDELKHEDGMWKYVYDNEGSDD